MLIFVFSFLSTQLNAQVDIETNEVQQVEIFLQGNAKLHSSDEIFNAQIESKKIKINNDHKNFLSIEKEGSVIIIENKPKKENFATDLKTAQKQKVAEVKKSIKTKTEKALPPVTHGFQDLIKNQPSSGKLAYLRGSLKQNFITPTGGHDFQKGISEKQFTLLIKLLNGLHEKKILDYNSQSKKFGFTKVLSVRPPPFLC
ncbi:hypothetical protein ASG31_13420 [Chryseobacterium sp. Leaf404]|uniref:hypothetical protein n=1 Tax=unclassified Chryseobacterium TaxID=2593645 RepID=UPI0006F5CC5A|nr:MULTISPECIES: hypothetical protein [unclassified Chryseobacterium]KQT16505.1 hypothetical protein ASG31_13420 [Chryseobacterium sp. Leaf404]